MVHVKSSAQKSGSWLCKVVVGTQAHFNILEKARWTFMTLIVPGKLAG